MKKLIVVGFVGAIGVASCTDVDPSVTSSGIRPISAAVRQLSESPAVLSKLGCLVLTESPTGQTIAVHYPSSVRVRTGPLNERKRMFVREVARDEHSVTVCYASGEDQGQARIRYQQSRRFSSPAPARTLPVLYAAARDRGAIDLVGREWLRSVAPLYYTRVRKSSAGAVVIPAFFQGPGEVPVQRAPLAPVYVTATQDPVSHVTWVLISDSEARWKLGNRAPASLWDSDYFVIWDGVDECADASNAGLWMFDEAARLSDVAAKEQAAISAIEQQHQAFCKLDINRPYLDCLDFFIMGAGTLGFQIGNNRDFDPLADPANSKLQLYLNPADATMVFIWQGSAVVNVSLIQPYSPGEAVVNMVNSVFFRPGNSPPSANQITDADVVVQNGGTRVIFSITATSAAATFPGITPGIKASIVYDRAADGSWDMVRSASATTPYPSLGIYRKVGSTFQVRDEFKEEWLGLTPHLWWTNKLSSRTSAKAYTVPASQGCQWQ